MLPEWDGESYCVREGCQSPATVEQPFAMLEADAVTEWVCQDHAVA